MNRYLVQHDYGMGVMLWWVRASSETEILETLADVEVLTEAEASAIGDDEIEEVRLDALEGALADLRDQRAEHKTQPGYGALVGRTRVYLRDADEEYEGAVYLSEVGPDGRMLRQVEQRTDGTAVRDHEFVINPPIDFRNPKFAAMEIPAETFEAAWHAAIDNPNS
jgi:hypothetical protein